MIYLIKILYMTFLLPPGIFIVILAAYSAFLFHRRNRAAKTVLALAVLLYLMATPLVGDAVVHSLESRYQPPAKVSGDVIIVLGGGATLDTPNVNGTGHLSGYAANRLLTGVQLYHKLHIPILVSGGQVLDMTGCEAEIAKSILIGLGVPEEQIIVENRSRNTTENALYSKEVIEARGLKNPILVTSAFHMERSVRQFEKVGLAVTPYSTDYLTNINLRFNIYQCIPSSGAMQNLQLGIKEYLGLLAVRWY